MTTLRPDYQSLPVKHAINSVPNKVPPNLPYGKISDASSGNSTQLPRASSASGSHEPYIAIPSDIYHDFEALKSVTKLDTPDLMRKLLKDYQRLAASPSHLLRERRLDGVIGDIVAARTSSALDLSKHSDKDSKNDRLQSPLSLNMPSMDQSCLDDEYSDDDEVDEDSIDESKPLDLTLHRQEPAASPDSAIVEDISAKGAATPHFSSVLRLGSHSMETYQSLSPHKHTGSYVINLEAKSEGNSSPNSMLAQVLKLDLPTRNVHKIQNYSIGSPTVLSAPDYKKLDMNTASPPCFTSDLHKSDEIKLAISKNVTLQNNVLCATKLGGLPSYSEALSSVLNSHKMSTRQLEAESLTDTSKAVVDVIGKSQKQEMNKSGVNFFQTSLDEPEVKKLSLELNSRLAQQQNDPTHRLLHQHFMQQQLKQDYTNQIASSPLSKEQQQQQLINQSNINSHLSALKVFSVQSPKPDTADNQNSKQSDVNFPNFLLESQSLGMPPSSITMTTPGTLTSASTIPMSAFFMTTPSNCVSNVVAVLHSLPEGVTGLQPFAFAPHPVPQSSSDSSSTPAHLSGDMIFTTANTVSGASYSTSSSATTTPPRADLAPCHSLDTHTSSPPLASAKPKPGRPRGKGGRGQVQRMQNKDMKLLTENTLFPGVYTSILKLPWSRRSRNKSKAKTISELKKEAQIIAHDKVNEDMPAFVSSEPSTDAHHPPNQESPDIDSKYNIMKGNADKQAAFKHVSEHIYVESQVFSSTDAMKLDQLQSIQLQKQKDLEQQQRLHAQYHQRLQEEQRKLTKQIEMSYLTSAQNPSSSESQASAPEAFSSDYSPTGSKNVTNPVTPDLMQGEEQFSSNEHSVMVFPSDDKKTGAAKSPRKRGRPPKTYSLHKPIDKPLDRDGSLTMTLLSTNRMETEPDNFLNVTTASTTTNFSILKSALSTTSFDGFAHRRIAENYTGSLHLSTNIIETNPEMQLGLDKKFTFLNSHMELESSRDMQQSGIEEVPVHPYLECDDESTPDEQDTAVSSDVTPDAKPRRKKVSRLLKSNENFMYATFKIKPKNGSLTPRKSRRKRKDVLASTAAAAETIANLRQKKLTDLSLSEGVKPASMVAWKFHEQYPHPNEDSSEKVTVEKRWTCLSCGNVYLRDVMDNAAQHCEACISLSTSGGEGLQRAVNLNRAMGLIDLELKAECCVTCGQVFQKHYSDTSARCNDCIRNSCMAIKSSKLFSFGDSPEPVTTSSAQPAPSSLFSFAPKVETPPEKEAGETKPSLSSSNPNRLHCSICRMEFSKICDYLQHIRESHDSPLGAQVDSLRKIRVSKTKKSLAHKTLTCPVEDCPHFFREQRDLDIHFVKKHSELGTCPHGDCTFTYSLREDLEGHLRFDHNVLGSLKTVPAPLLTNGEVDDCADNLSAKSLMAPGSSEKPLQCEFCEYRCRQKNALTWHMRKHPEAASLYKRYNSLNTE
ncbi:hypothetical protein Btru_033212 [Bulinus truncatus]|nr:hypothetical protein Btru_033212 [Bulinus truncatus]